MGNNEQITSMIYKREISPPFYQRIGEGTLTFWVTENTHSFQVGDIIIFFERDDIFTDRSKFIKTEVVYVMSGHGIKEDYVCLGLKVIEA